MGTSIKLEAFKGESENDKQWEILTEYFFKEYDDAEDCGDFLKSGVIYCPYRCADLDAQIPTELREKLKGSGIEINLYIEEVSDCLSFEVEE